MVLEGPAVCLEGSLGVYALGSGPRKSQHFSRGSESWGGGVGGSWARFGFRREVDIRDGSPGIFSVE